MRRKKEIGIGLKIDPELWQAVLDLADKNGVSGNFAVRRALIRMVSEGKIHWPVDDELEKREHAKFGSATPVFDLTSEAPVKGSGSGQKVPSNPAQSSDIER